VPSEGKRATPLLESVVTCPGCGFDQPERMPLGQCVFFYECRRCRAMLRAKPGDCCVFCTYGSVACPPVQATRGAHPRA
jgi:hypothetical protein